MLPLDSNILHAIDPLPTRKLCIRPVAHTVRHGLCHPLEPLRDVDVTPVEGGQSAIDVLRGIPGNELGDDNIGRKLNVGLAK
jgi:hypothetical protein